jgi:hypothetical protein
MEKEVRRFADADFGRVREPIEKVMTNDHA